MIDKTREHHATREYWVVRNDQQELAVWPADRELPLGWQRTTKQGTYAECLAYIKLGCAAQRKPAIAPESPQ